VKNRLKVLRAENNWSQSFLAQKLGVSRQTINSIETGKYDPSLPLAFDLARIFTRRIDDIFFPEPSAEKPPAPELEPYQELDISLI
jgi:putative transcriptional regulator